MAADVYLCTVQASDIVSRYYLQVDQAESTWSWIFNDGQTVEQGEDFSSLEKAEKSMKQHCLTKRNGNLVSFRTYAGEFTYAHKIPMLSYSDRKTCEADDGTWQDNFCVFDVEDSVVVQKTEKGYSIEAMTVASNAHTCQFSGDAGLVNDDVIVASTIAEEFDEKKNDWQKTICTVAITYLSLNEISLTTNEKCRTYCGMRANLYIQKATRQE